MKNFLYSFIVGLVFLTSVPAAESFRTQNIGVSVARESLNFSGLRTTAMSVALTHYLNDLWSVKTHLVLLPYMKSDFSDYSPDPNAKYPESSKDYWAGGLFNLQIQKATKVNSRTILLAGAGPVFGAAKSRYTTRMYWDSFGNGGGIVTTVTDEKYILAGLSASLGCEIYLVTNVSIFAGYTFSVTAMMENITSKSTSEGYANNEYYVDDPSLSEKSEKSVRFSNMVRSFGVCFYF